MTHTCVSKLIITGSDTGFSPDWRKEIIWPNAGILSIGHLGTNVREIVFEIYFFFIKEMKMSAKSMPFCRGRNVLGDVIY